MRLELDGAGKLYIRDVTNDAWGYLTEQRRKAGDPWEWYFAHAVYNGSVRVYYSSYNFADKELMRHLITLIKRYGLGYNASVGLLLQSWQAMCVAQKNFAEWRKKHDALEVQTELLKAILCYGCNRCEDFCKVRDGDDMIGCCRRNGQLTRLTATPLCVEHGDRDRYGNYYLGQKFYPTSGCKYLEMEGEKA